MITPFPSDDMEQRAASQRQRLHDSVTELRSNVRERLDVKKAARTHVWPASAAAGLLALAFGYGLAGAFTD
jgi:methyl coenzyme M reductase beta subunit